MNDRPLRPAAARVQEILAELGLATQVIEFAETTRTSAEAAAQIGCTVAQIAKSLIFRAKTSNRPVLVIASGINRVNEKAIEALLGEKIGKADADLLKLETIWAAAGTPFAVFRLVPDDLQRLTGGQVARIAQPRPVAETAQSESDA